MDELEAIMLNYESSIKQAFQHAIKSNLKGCRIGSNFGGTIELYDSNSDHLRSFEFQEFLKNMLDGADVNELNEWQKTFTEALTKIGEAIKGWDEK